MSKTWHEYFLDQIENIASKSKDPSTKVGAIIVSSDHGSRATGFNGFARGVNEDIEVVPERFERPEKYEWIVHAEHNAILYAARHGIALQNCSLYVDWHPCHKCADAIIQAGISEVVIDADSDSYNNEQLRERWKATHERAAKKLEEAGVAIVHYTRQTLH